MHVNKCCKNDWIILVLKGSGLLTDYQQHLFYDFTYDKFGYELWNGKEEKHCLQSFLVLGVKTLPAAWTLHILNKDQ